MAEGWAKGMTGITTWRRARRRATLWEGQGYEGHGEGSTRTGHNGGQGGGKVRARWIPGEGRKKNRAQMAE